ncbi:NF-kappa-B inhibitor zeta isoform X2 [Callorhinchus milii]|nr:NF-kappa-B inhibitor zeta isoform X2 [Callorhinchus milii]
MIVDRVSEHLGDVFDQSIPNAANLGYFYQSSPPDSEPSSPPGGQSAPTSPQSDSSECQSRPADTAYTRLTITDQVQFGQGGSRRQAFKGVRVRNPVKALLEHIRGNRNFPSSKVEYYGTQLGSAEEPYLAEIKNLLVGTKRLAPENLTDSPPYKQSPTVNSSYPLTPPQTPNSFESSDEIHKTEPTADVNPDVLQDIIKMLQNDTHQISLNTVQVSWANVAKKEHLFQGEEELVNKNYMQELQQIQMHLGQPQDFQLPSSSQIIGQPQNFQQCQDFQQLFASEQHQRFHQIPCEPQPQNFQHFTTNCHLQDFQDSPDPTLSQVFQSVDEQAVGNEPQPECYPLAQSFSSVPSTMYYPTPNHLPQSQNSSPMNNAPGKSFFQWQLEQEEKKLSHLTTEQLLAKDSDGDTLLHIAVAQGRRALSYVLGKKMFAINMMDVKEHNGQSALQVAVAANQHLIVQDLASLGAQVNTADRWGRTPLHVVAEKGYFQVLVAIEKGLVLSGQRLNLEVTNFDGMTALHLAILTHNSMVRDLHNKVQQQCHSVEEMLMKKKSLLDTIKTFVQMGASIETRERKTGRAALHLAAEEANVELLRFFLEQPTSLNIVNAKAYSNNTALHIVAGLQGRVSQVDAVRLLMRKGADPSARNLENEQPVHLVPDGPRGEEVKRILKGKAVQSRVSLF